MKRTIALVLLSALAVVPAVALAKSEPMVGGQAMFPSKDIVDNAVNSADHTTLVAAGVSTSPLPRPRPRACGSGSTRC